MAVQMALTSPRTMTLGGLSLAVAAAWLGLIALHSETAFALDGILALCLAVGLTADLALFPAVAVMWLLMAVAMMLPTAMPAIDTYVNLARKMESGRGLRITLFISGYVLAWGGMGAMAALAQIGLGSVPAATANAGLWAGGLIALAGAYQLSALKQRCLDLCRNPLLYFMARWRESFSGTMRLGFDHGVICIGCCWALMMLMFIGGAMNPLWMAALGLVMLAEKVVPGAAQWGRLAGYGMLAAGTALMIVSLF